MPPLANAFIAMALVLAGSEIANAQTPIVLQHDERPPFLKTEPDGSVSGTAATPAVQAFKKAGIPYAWQYMSAARQLAMIKSGARVCSVGWYKTPERERFAKFSKAISQDSPMIGLANIHFNAPENSNIDQILADENINILIKESIVYGPFLDTKFAQMKARRIPTSNEFGPMIRLIHLGRAQLTFIPIEEANYYIATMGYSAKDFNVIHFAEMPAGEKRYIMCSKSVEDAVIDKLNAALK
jgi:polar amino acid transport system substrate-binding protein